MYVKLMLIYSLNLDSHSSLLFTFLSNTVLTENRLEKMRLSATSTNNYCYYTSNYYC